MKQIEFQGDSTGMLVPAAKMTSAITNESTPIRHPALATISTIAKLRAAIQMTDLKKLSR